MGSVYACSNCGYESPFYLADCPGCGQGFFDLQGGAARAVAAGPPGELRICYKCDHETRETGDGCPRCRSKRLLTPKAIRVLGGVLVGLGLFLVLLMGAVTILVAGIVAHSNDPGATTRFSGGKKELALIFGLFGLVIAFGAACTVGGALQLVRGRRSKTVVRVVLGLFVALAVMAQLIYIFLD